MKASSILGITALALLMPAVALAQYSPYAPKSEGYSNFMRSAGASITLGGGVVGFSDSDLADVTDAGGAWDVRVTAGTNSYVGGEIAYHGTAQNVTALGVNDGMLLSNGVEGILRLHFLTGAVQPYIFGGVGYQRFELNADTNTSDLNENDDVLNIPAGGGIAFTVAENLLLDGRFTFRPTFEDELLPGSELHTWNASASVGYRF